jgi:hypothetical protein
VYDSDWTPDFLSEFEKRRGYDLTPYLPELFSGTDELAKSVRHDWGETLGELVDENYLQPLTAWAHAHHTLFRSQTYGEPAVTLSSNSLVDLPEGEPFVWTTCDFRGGVDVAAFTGVSRGAAGYEGGGGSVFS